LKSVTEGKGFTAFCCIFSGLLLTIGLPDWDLYPLAWCALVPLFRAIQGKTPKQALGWGYLCGMVHFLTTLYWIRHVIFYYGGLPLPLAIGVLVLLCGYLALYPAVFAWVAQRWERHHALWVLGLPAVWVTLEWVRAHALTGFPWASLGYTQTRFLTLVQVADVTGVYGVSWLVVLANTVVVSVLWRRPSRVGIAVLALCMVGSLSYGALRLDQVRALQKESESWAAAVVQGNIDQSVKWNPAFQQETLRRYRELSLEAAAGDPPPDLIVWPETAAPFFYGREPKLTAQLNGMLSEIGRPVLFGSPAIIREDGEARLQNRAYLVDAEGVSLGTYAKRHLVPFGEYVPLQKLLFFVQRLVQAAGDFVPGSDASPIVWGGRKLGVLICYEGIFPALARETVRKGASALVIITNDAWYGPTSAPYQHLEMARWRAMEFRVPVLRAANTGVSAIFDGTGGECGRIPLDEAGQLACSVRSSPIETFYAVWGDVFAWLCVLVALVCAVLAEILRGSGVRGARRYVATGQPAKG
jgi:apolipoprotein N-acyltransferase